MAGCTFCDSAESSPVLAQQQVNNGYAPTSEKAPAHAAKVENAPTGLLEKQHGEWLDTGAESTAGGVDPHLAPVGAVHRPEKR